MKNSKTSKKSIRAIFSQNLRPLGGALRVWPHSMAALAILASSLLLLSNCAKKEETKKIEPTYSSLYSNLFSQRCIECHQTGGQADKGSGFLSFSTSGVGYSGLVGTAVQDVSGTVCASGSTTGKRVENSGGSTGTSRSYVLAIFFSEYGQGVAGWNGDSDCTPNNHTAYTTSVPSADEKTALVQWIQGGALNN